MGIIVEIPEFRVKYKDVFNLRNFYVMFHQALLQEGWLGMEGDSDHEDLETYYSENIFQKGAHQGGKEMWVYWRTFRFPGDRYSGYFRYLLDIDMHMAYIQEVEVVRDGKKMKAHKGEIQLFFRPRMESDFNKQWENHWLLSHFKHIYEHRILHAEIEKKEKELWQFSYYLQNVMKQYFELRMYEKMPEPMWGRKYGFEG